ncbi:MAG: hypothetical protein RL094_745 [Candidatus Parcubacteria bacterium]
MKSNNNKNKVIVGIVLLCIAIGVWMLITPSGRSVLDFFIQHDRWVCTNIRSQNYSPEQARSELIAHRCYVTP